MNLELLLAEAEESSSGIDLLLPATSELVAGIAAFAIVFFFIWKWALPALNETLESRASAIEGQIKEAEETKAEAEKSKAEYDELVSNADSEVQTIIDEGKAAAEKIKEDMLAEAKKEAEAIVEKAKSDSEAEKERVSSELKGEVADLSLEISQKVASSMSKDDQKKLIDKFIKDMGVAETMSVETFSKGLVEIIASSDDSERVENEILQVFKSLSDSSEALDVFRNFGIPVEKKIEAVQNLLSTRVLPLTVDLVTLTISQGYADNLNDIESSVANFIANKRGASVAKVVTAVELDDKTQKALQKAIKSKVGTDVELSIDVDPSVIGGISVSVGERTFDGLLSSKFSEIKTVLEGR